MDRATERHKIEVSLRFDPRPGAEHVNIPSMRAILLLGVSVAAAMALLCACDREPTVRAYSTPKETASETSLPIAPTAGKIDLRWTLPARWKTLPAENDPSAAFSADARIAVDPDNPRLVLSVSHLGNTEASRSLILNVNRWERIEGFAKSSEADLSKVTSHATIGGEPANLIDLNGNGKRLLGAMIAHDQQTWFLKLVGPSDAISAHKAEFDAFVASIHFEAPAESSEPAASQSPPAGLHWNVPAAWKQEPAMSPLLAKFNASNGAITIKVSSFAAGNFGDLSSNLNRWHGEVDLPSVDTAQAHDVPETTIGNRKWKIYDFAGPESAGAARKRVIVGQTEQNGEVFFFKMLGPAEVVAQQKSAFDQFLSSVQLGT